MKKTRWTLVMIALALGVASLGATGCKKSGDEHGSASHAHKYKCSMHPEVVKDQPGTCPKCNMNLVEMH